MPAAFIDRRTAVKFASISLRTLDRLIARGLPTYRTSSNRGKILIRPDDLVAFLMHQPSRQQNLDVLVEEMVKDFTKQKTAVECDP
jgi:hypothetical protein